MEMIMGSSPCDATVLPGTPRDSTLEATRFIVLAIIKAIHYPFYHLPLPAGIQINRGEPFSLSPENEYRRTYRNPNLRWMLETVTRREAQKREL